MNDEQTLFAATHSQKYPGWYFVYHDQHGTIHGREYPTFNRALRLFRRYQPPFAPLTALCIARNGVIIAQRKVANESEDIE